MTQVEFPELDDLFGGGVDVVSAQQFAEFVGVAYESMRAFCVEYDVPKLANSYAITRDRGEELLEAINEALEAAEEEAEDPDSEGDQDPDHDPDDPDCDCSDCEEDDSEDD